MTDTVAGPPHLLIRVDAGAEIGTGHVMRMIALAQAYQDRGGKVTMACRTCPDGVASRVHQAGITRRQLHSGSPGGDDDLKEAISLAKSCGAEWVIVDGYHFGIEYQRVIREAGLRLLVLDDHGYSDDWCADALLNQNIFGPERTYTSEVVDCLCLLGTRFALLRREFREDAEHGAEIGREAGATINRLLITLGGGNVQSATGRVLQALNAVTERSLEIKVLVGAGDQQLEPLSQLTASSPHTIELLQNVRDMPSLYRWADGVISAGGSTCWEWMFYGLPAAVICLADNQLPVVAALLKHRLALDLGWHETLEPGGIAQRLRGWLSGDRNLSDGPPPDLAVDGYGADRVAALLDGSRIMLRRATALDARLWFDWANDPAVRASGFYPEPVAWETHQAWFTRHQISPDSRLWIGFDLDSRALGYVRLHHRDGDEWEVGVAIDPERRGKGVGIRLVQLALRKFDVESTAGKRSLCARIKPANTASLRLFEALGFEADAIRTTAECCTLTRKAG